MIQIRQNIFETNSSSTHALCIDMSEYYTKDKEQYFNEWRKEARPICVQYGDYGRCPAAPLVSLQEKVNYLWSAVVDTYYTYDWEKREYIEKDLEKIKWWKEKILNELPNNSYFEEVIDNGCWGIDHVDNLLNFLKKCEKNPRYIHCLLDDGSFIELGGDEYPNIVNVFLPTTPYETITLLPSGYAVYIKGN